MSPDPKVTIVIPVYNGSNYLREAIDSALAQTYKNIEVVVVNDGSQDGGKTEEIARSYGDSIRYFNKANGGVASALNRGIQEMKGEYFSWLSHDDIYYPNKVEIQIEHLKNWKDTVILYGDYDIMQDNVHISITHLIPHIEPADFPVGLITGHPIHGCTALVPRICFEDIGLFNEKLITTQDYDLWFRMAKKYLFIHIPKVIICSRRHDEQSSNVMKTLHEKEVDELYVRCLNGLFNHDIMHLSGKGRDMLAFECYLNLSPRGFYTAAKRAKYFFNRFTRFPKRYLGAPYRSIWVSFSISRSKLYLKKLLGPKMVSYLKGIRNFWRGR